WLHPAGRPPDAIAEKPLRYHSAGRWPADHRPTPDNTSLLSLRRSQGVYVLCLQALLALRHSELHLLALDQRAVPLATNCAEVHKHIWTRFTLNETKTLGIVEPLNRTGLPIRHSHNLHITHDPPPGKTGVATATLRPTLIRNLVRT